MAGTGLNEGILQKHNRLGSIISQQYKTVESVPADCGVCSHDFEKRRWVPVSGGGSCFLVIESPTWNAAFFVGSRRFLYRTSPV
jgi:hypothetical protein